MRSVNRHKGLPEFVRQPTKELTLAVRLEHANLVVRNIDEMIRFLKVAFPEFRIRHDGTGKDGMRWVHAGTDETYIALMEANAESVRRWVPYSGEPGVKPSGIRGR